jgi:hypothetical protein
VQPKAAFYCMSSRLYFLGAVGMINSLRLVGHTEPLFLLDCGLTDEQREMLGAHVTLVPAPSSADPEPFLLKAVAPLEHPADVMVLIDADMVVCRPLTPLIEQAAEERVVAFKDNIDRFVPAWGDLLGLGATRRQPYVSSGLVFLGGAVGHEVLRLMNASRSRVDYDRSHFAENVPDYPFMYLDQDILNAVLATRVEPDRTVILDTNLAPIPPFRRLQVLDERALRCAHADGTEPYVLHQFVRKPWVEPMYHSPYSRLLARLLLGPDIAIRVPEEEVPLRMRNGPLARLERRRVDATDLVRWYVRDVIPEWLGRRVGALRRRRAARGR